MKINEDFICVSIAAAIAITFLTILVTVFLQNVVFPEKPQQSVSARTTLTTVEHDGHLFVVRSYNAILHHPDCRCQAR